MSFDFLTTNGEMKISSMYKTKNVKMKKMWATRGIYNHKALLHEKSTKRKEQRLVFEGLRINNKSV